eukprot:3577004-Pyramimonas_sp.AAC.1
MSGAVFVSFSSGNGVGHRRSLATASSAASVCRSSRFQMHWWPGGANRVFATTPNCFRIGSELAGPPIP